ncbi:MAG: S-layer family protein [Nostoc sp. ChiQUE01a]|nr:S-layer family protein [Nostoc sp. ChiQUE01a]
MGETCKIRECVGAARRRHRLFFASGCCIVPFALLAVSVASFPVTAQVTVDETLGNETSVVVPNQTVGGQPATLIEGGAFRGANLFHSFREFNVGDGQRIYFANPTGIENIFSRVTGSTASNILGTLGVNGSANLFLINPNSIIFGPNAQLDVRGSLLVTTANAMQFGNQGFFNVSDPQAPPLLTINPSALWFNQTANQPVIRSTANAVGLQTAPRQSLLLVGGVVELDGGKILAPGGRVELGSVAGTGIVGLQFQDNQWRLVFGDDVERTDISVTNNAQINVRADGGASIRINARNFSMTGENTALLAGIDAGLGDSNTQAGDIEINATAAVKIDASLIDNSILQGAIANGGKIQIQTESLSLTNGAQLNSDLFGKGNLGDLIVNAKNVLIDERGRRGSSGLVSNVRTTNAEGNSSNIIITTESLTASNGGRISTTTRGRGNAGNLTINASDTVSFLGFSQTSGTTSGAFTSVAATGVGNAGNLTINTGSLLVRQGASLRTSSFGKGNAGDITINASDRVELDGIKPPPRAIVGGIDSFIQDGAVGKGGDITITTGSLFVKDGTQISASSFGQGNAGNITIIARETAAWDGTTSNGFFSSATTSVERLFFPELGFIGNATGNGGTITVTAQNVSLTNGAKLDAKIKDAPGQAGSIIINADTVTLSGTNLEYGNASSLLTNTIGDTTALGGEIRISANRLQMFNGGLLSAASESDGRGGDIRIQVNTLDLQTGGQLVTTAFRRGNAGDILVTAKDQIRIRGSDSTFLARKEALAKLSIEFPQFAEFAVYGNSPTSNSGLFANTQVDSTGQGGTISIQTGNLFVEDSGRISVTSQGRGIAGKINVTSGSISLKDRGQLIAESASGNGGDINLQVQDILLLRRNSLISTTAGISQAGGDGGNITINAPFIIGLANENSDIIANAFNGQGGRVDINAKNIFGLRVRSREDLQTLLNSQTLDPNLLSTSDISAISQTNPTLNGIINIDALNLNPTQGVTELPTDLVDVAQQINQQLCNITQNSSFIITGRGGLPETPNATLKPDATWEDWRVLADESPVVNDAEGADLPIISSSDNHLLLKFLRVLAFPRPPKFRSPEAGAPTSLRVSPNDKSSPEHDIKPVLEAQSLLVDAKGIVHLTAQRIFSCDRHLSGM